MKKRKFSLRVLLSSYLVFCQFQPGVAYTSVAYTSVAYTSVAYKNRVLCAAGIIVLLDKNSLRKLEQ